MEDHWAFMCHPHFIRAAVCSLVFSLVCLAGGCGAGPGSETESKQQQKYEQSLKAQMQQRAAVQKAGPGKRAGRRP